MIKAIRPIRSGWLFALVTDAVYSHRPAEALQLLAEMPPDSKRLRARAYLKRILRETGLLFGTPSGPAPGSTGDEGPGDQLTLAVVRTLAAIALDVAALLEAPPGHRREQVLLLFAVLVGDHKLAEEIGRAVSQPDILPLPRKWWTRVESQLEKRAARELGDPVYGLLLHNAAVYADAQAFGRQAIELFERGRLRPAAARRRFFFAARQKSLLTKVLLGLACVERQPNLAAQRAVLRQIDDLQLPWRQRSAVKRAAKSFFAHAPTAEALAQQVRSRESRRFVLEQTILASLVDGSRSPREVAFIRSLAAMLKVSAEELDRIEIEMAEFFAKNRSIVDVYKISPGAGAMGEELVQSIQRAVEKNFYRLIQEVRETGELSVLLTRAARGQKLTSEERGKMRARLIDVAKAIPALAIFAAPGGILLLIALAKVLPFNILPSAFQDEGDEDAVPRSTKRADA